MAENRRSRTRPPPYVLDVILRGIPDELAGRVRRLVDDLAAAGLAVEVVRGEGQTIAIWIRARSSTRKGAPRG